MATLTDYPFTKQVNITKLVTEIQTAALSTAMDHIDCSDNGDGTWTTNIWFVDVLSSDDQTTLSNVVTAHINSPPTPDAIRAKIVAARMFGQSVIDEVAMDNILAGITSAQVATMIANYGAVMAMLQSGSLYTALLAMEAATPDTVMTQSRINKYIAQIKAYLGIQ
jgi:hypothetical protein